MEFFNEVSKKVIYETAHTKVEVRKVKVRRISRDCEEMKKRRTRYLLTEYWKIGERWYFHHNHPTKLTECDAILGVCEVIVPREAAERRVEEWNRRARA